MEEKNHLEPRVSSLEKGQETLQRELISLSESVKEQGSQLTSAITKLSDANVSNYNNLLDKIGERNKTDWQTFWTAAACVVLLIGAISTPVWMNFSYVDKLSNKTDSKIEKLEVFTIESIKDRADLRAQIETGRILIDKLESRLDREWKQK